MEKAGNDQSTRLRDCFLEGYRAAATAESAGDKVSVQPVGIVAAILEEAISLHTGIRQTLEGCRQSAEGIKSLPEQEQEVARLELQQNLRHLLACCEAISNHVRTSSSPEPMLLEKGQEAEVEKRDDRKSSPHPKEDRKRSSRR